MEVLFELGLLTIMFAIVLFISAIIFLILFFLINKIEKRVKKGKRANEEYHEREYRGIDYVSDNELEYLGKNSKKKEEIEKYKQDYSTKSNTHEAGSKKSSWVKKLSIPDRIFFIFSVIFASHCFISFIIIFLLIFVGLFIDGAMYDNPSGVGHAFPVLTWLLPTFGLFGVGFVSIVLLLMVIVSFIVMMINKIVRKTKKK